MNRATESDKGENFQTKGVKVLEGKIVVVTGGLSGIGEAIARRMAREGAKIVAADLKAQTRSLGESAVEPFQTDVADPASVGRMVTAVVEKHSRIDCLVHCAAIGKVAPFLETSLELFDNIIAVNLRGTFIVGQAVARVMRRSGGGAIVNIASVSGMTGNEERSAYGASKGGVVQLSRVMAIDLAVYNIRVNVIAPGPVETPMAAQMHSQEARQRWIERTALHRYATPDEITGAAVFLCSDDASFVTGHVLAVDGGFLGSGLVAPRTEG